MNKLPLSVFIIAKNEEDRLQPAIRSVIDWVDEVIVIDSGSSDRTVDMASQLGARTVYNEWKGYGPQKIFGENLCRNKWILNIDADERISAELKDEVINEFTSGEPKYKAYELIIKIVSRFERKASKYAPRTIAVRLYNREFAGFKSSTVHDSVILKEGINTPIGRFNNPVLHNCFRSYRHAIEKINFYSTLQAEDMMSKNRNPSALRIIIEPFFAFFKGYFIRRYCFLGVDGFIESIIYAFARTIRLAKAREIYKETKNPSVIN